MMRAGCFSIDRGSTIDSNAKAAAVCVGQLSRHSWWVSWELFSQRQFIEKEYEERDDQQERQCGVQTHRAISAASQETVETLWLGPPLSS